jgi:hypothetical protein
MTEREQASEVDRGVMDSGSRQMRVSSEGELDESARERKRKEETHLIWIRG